MNQFPQAPEYTIRAVSNFFENSRRYSQLKMRHRCHWHRWQMKKIFNQKSFNYFCGTPSFKFTLKCQQSDIVSIICHRRRWYRWCTFTFEYLREFSEKNRNDPNVIFGGLGEGRWFMKKTWAKKSRDTVCLNFTFYYLRKSTFLLGGSAKRLEL
jgi:hypothetical protein